jgi:phosphate transport system permease protein
VTTAVAAKIKRTNADVPFRWALRGAGAVVLVVLALMIVYTTASAWPVLRKEGLGFVTGTTWFQGSSQTDITGTYGALPFIYGTIVSSVIALLVGVPLAVGVSLTLVEIAPARVSRLLSYAVDLLAAVPSVIYGLWGVLFFVPVVVRPVMEKLSASLGKALPVFAGPAWSLSYFSAGVVLAIMIVPIVAAVTREVLKAVPDGERQGAYALGATRWEVIRGVVIPRSKAGIVGAAMLGLGRALGETIAVALLIGGAQTIEKSLFHPGNSIAAHIASTFGEATPEGIHALMAIGVALFVITILVNVAARLIVRRIAIAPGEVT